MGFDFHSTYGIVMPSTVRNKKNTLYFKAVLISNAAAVPTKRDDFSTYFYYP